jgi:hypothetical protein
MGMRTRIEMLSLERRLAIIYAVPVGACALNMIRVTRCHLSSYRSVLRANRQRTSPASRTNAIDGSAPNSFDRVAVTDTDSRRRHRLSCIVNDDINSLTDVGIEFSRHKVVQHLDYENEITASQST